MKKIFAIILCLFCLVSLVACDSDDGAQQGADTTEKPTASSTPTTSEKLPGSTPADTDNVVEPSSQLSYRVGNSKEWKTLDGADSFADIFEDVLWEPGLTACVVFKYEKAAEASHNQWTLRLDRVSDSDPILPFLPDVIDVYVKERNVIEEIRYGYSFEGWKAPGTLTEVLNSDIAKGGFDSDGVAYVTVVLQMQVTAGNEYMGVSLDDDINVQLFVTAEENGDSFSNEYDAEATFSVGN